MTALDFGDDPLALAPDDAVVLAVPPVVAASLIPDLTAPSEFRAIVNAHFRIAPPAGLPPMTGIINGTAEWLFAFPDRLSVTISSADRLLDTPRVQLAAQIWREVAAVAGIAAPLPPWQIVRERRATFAALPRRRRQASGPAHALEQFAARRRLDGDRPAGNHRGLDTVRQPGGRFDRNND